MPPELGSAISFPGIAVIAPHVRPDVLQRGVWIAMRADVERVVEIGQPSRFFHPQLNAHGTRIAGTVEGSERYNVGLDALDDGRISCRCACPYFADRGVPCKHVVAFFLESLRRRSWTPPNKIVGIRADVERERSGDRQKKSRGDRGRDGGREHAREQGHDPARERGRGRDRDRGFDRGLAPQPERVAPKAALQFVAGEAWRWTLAPIVEGAPAPLVYTFLPEIPGPPSTAFEFFRRHVGSNGIVQLAREPFTAVQAMELDATDAQIVERIASGDKRALLGGPPDQSARIDVITSAARAGRLHQRLGHLSLGAAMRWDGDIPRSAQIHIEFTDSGAREWARLIAADRPPIDCLRRATVVVSGLFWLDDLIVAAPWFGTSLTSDRWASGTRFGSRRNRLVMHGPKTYTREELPELVRALRNETPEDLLRGETLADVLHLDPRLGVSYFEATPISVLRLDSGSKRSTVDVSALARYRHPTRADVVVDRDPREHCIVEDPQAPEAIVPRPDVRTEYAIEEEAAKVIRKARGSGDKQWRIPRENLPQLVAAAASAGIIVEMSKQPARAGGKWTLSVTSGTDWFQLHGSLDTPEGTIPLSALVAAAKLSPDAIEILPLQDGTSVLIPAKLRAVLRRLAKILAKRENDELRFDKSDALLLDSILEQADHRKDDEAFRHLRERLKAFDTPHPLDAPKSFKGTLRDYQRDGLGWFEALRELGFGGCLADEMGLGKTVQILAMLARHYSGTKPKAVVAAKGKKKVTKKKVTKVVRRPTLIVVPRSIVRNWQDEAARFAPKLRVVDMSHANRSLSDATFAKCDVALMTYGTLLRDVERLAKRRFDYVILDEAQAIKNASARSSKAAKCLQADNRLAMTGTPIENHLGELWSLMDFLNPGLSRRLERLAGGGDNEDLDVVRRAVRPFLLRRTKRDVAKDLPERIEQTIFCDMTEEQQEHYDSLLERIRTDLLGKIDANGLGRSKLQVLEGLLRLRQIACHPVLADKRRKDVGSGKLEALMPMLEESAEEGRKTLVFSQFTSFLALVRAELDERGIVYEYLDGATRDRADRVKRFNSDEKCSVFLLSLKAGGVGLNLQAAERVVLLDPWWNPAVEAQAIDRAHRIGQTRTVHAMRLVSSGTVEERVLELQKKKRDIADAIMSEDAGPLASMTKSDLEFLLDAKPSGKAKKKAKS